MAGEKKQIPLRVSAQLYAQLARWAEDDFRSINGQIEYLLTQCVKQRIKNGGMLPDPIEPEEDETVKAAMKPVEQEGANDETE